ncbi:glycosyltransferase family 4 protein [Trueperella sp. LYQ143]|uniref:glycosyltransferase family 4 protein n=1 Tax=unclassified Trueperella TaxID=2630174 RepID=UPI003983A056
MRIAIVSRIFAPETSAASFRLEALAEYLHESGHDVEVITVRPPRGMETTDSNVGYRVRRAPVLRDAQHYVRGYLPYLSFDIPMFFRLITSRRFDAVIVEPPPTTGFFARLGCLLQRTPYAYYAADIWSDAAAQTGAPRIVCQVVRSIERFAWRGAALVFAVSPGVAQRLAELGITERVSMIGNGVNVRQFCAGLRPWEALESSATTASTPAPIEFVYAGTASEWHGAEIFVTAFARFLRGVPTQDQLPARLRFIGGGAHIDTIRQRAEELGISSQVTIEPTRPARECAPILQGATAALASVRPGAGYDFAFATKLYSGAVCGAPLLYAGIGVGREFVETRVANHPIGYGVEYDADAIAQAMHELAALPINASRRRAVSQWAAQNLSLTQVARRAAHDLITRISAKSER